MADCSSGVLAWPGSGGKSLLTSTAVHHTDTSSFDSLKRPGAVTESVEHWTRVWEIVSLNPRSSQTNHLFN